MKNGVPSIHPQDPGFASHIQNLVFNKLSFGRVPDVVVCPRDEEEVAQAVRAAGRDGLRIAVLSGGHSWIGAPVREGGMLLDLSALAKIEIDPATKTMRIGPAARGGDVTEKLAAHGLAYPTGHCATPGSGGYLLGGGLGLNSGHWGPACFSVRSARIVTAEGEIVVASETENRDLLWLVRGAGPAFPGVVTEFEVELQERPADTRVSSWVFSFNDLPAVTRWVSQVSPLLPSNVEVFTAASGPGRHEHMPSQGFPQFIVTVVAIAYTDSVDQAREALAPFASLPGCQILQQIDLEAIAFEKLSVGFDAEYPEDHRYLADAFWTDMDVEGAMTPLMEEFLKAPSGKNNYVAAMPTNGSRWSLSPEQGAFSMNCRTLVMAYAIWDDPVGDGSNRAWITNMSKLLEPSSQGAFVSEADHESHPCRLRQSFSETSLKRLLESRAKWDPSKVFHMPGQGL